MIFYILTHPLGLLGTQYRFSGVVVKSLKYTLTILSNVTMEVLPHTLPLRRYTFNAVYVGSSYKRRSNDFATEGDETDFHIVNVDPET